MRWVLNSDGAANKEAAGIGVILELSSWVIIEEAFRLEKQMTNNEAEYRALLYGLELALKLGVQNLKVFLDSKLVSGQINGIFGAKDQRMKFYYDKATQLIKYFRRIDIQAIRK